MQKITSNVWVETGAPGCNHGFVVTAEGVVLIDAPFTPSEAERWQQAVAAHGSVCYLINTEPHIDHVSGDYFFPGPVVGHALTREGVMKLSAAEVIQHLKELDPRGIGSPLMQGYRVRLPTITFDSEVNLYVGRHTFKVMHRPGHTSAETAIYIPEERVLFTGDNVTYNRPVYMHEAVPEGWLRSLRQMQELDAEKVVPGHGDVCDLKYLEQHAAVIEDWLNTVREAVRRGLTREQAVEQVTFFDKYPPLPGSEARVRDLERRGIARVYDIITTGMPRG